MFNVLSPFFLALGAAAVLLPILIHLLLRNRVVRIDFAAMRFLMESRKPLVRWLRLKQLLILLLRIAIVAILALAFARPFLSSESSFTGWNKGDREIGIVIDASASLAAGNNTDAMRRKLDEVLGGIEAGTTISAYVAAGEASRILAEREAMAPGLAARLRNAVEPVPQQSNLRAAVQVVDDILRGAPVYQREIYVLSDFQRSIWPENAGSLKLASRATIIPVPVAEAPWKNMAIIDAQVPRDDEQEWACTVFNYGTESPRVPVSLVINGKKVATKEISPGDSRTQVVQFSHRASSTGAITGYFEIGAGDDAFDADNRFYFSSYQQRATRILAVNGEPADGAGDELFFLRRALNVRGSRFALTEINGMDGESWDPRAFDVVLLANVKGISRTAVERVEEMVQQGGGLLIAPGDKISPTVFNRSFGKLAPANIDKAARQSLDRAAGEALLLSNTEHPALQKFADPLTGDVSNARVYQHWQVTPSTGAQVLASFADGSPALLAANFGRGRILMLTFPLDAEWSNLPIQTIYLPLMHNLLEYLKPDEKATQKLEVGQPIFLGDRFSPRSAITVTIPAGEEQKLEAGQVIFPAAPTPGIFRFRQGGLEHSFAVNLPRSESTTELITLQTFLARFEAADEKVSIDGRQQMASLQELEVESRQQLWKLALILVIIMLVVESLLANRTPR